MLDASKAIPLLTGGPYGNITADIVDSIIQNGTLKSNFPGLLLAPANVVTDTYTRIATRAWRGRWGRGARPRAR